MIPLLAIPIVGETTDLAASNSGFISSFLAQPIDEILFDLLLWFGWIPVLVTFAYGLTQLWINYKWGQYAGTRKYVLLAINVPAITEQTPRALENMFHTLYSAKSSITWKEKWIDGKLNPVFSFEIVSSEGYIQFLVRTQTRFRDIIEAGIYAHYPDAEIAEVEDYTQDFPAEYPNDEYDMWGGELTLSKSQIFPIRTYVDFEDRLTQEIKDPLGYTLEQLAKMRPGEHFWIQIIVQPSNNDWTEESVKHVKALYGDKETPKKPLWQEALNGILAWPALLLDQIAGTELAETFSSSDAKQEKDQFRAFNMSILEKEEAEAVLRKASKVGFGTKIRMVYVAQKNAFVKGERTAMVKGIFNQYTNLNLNKFGLYGPQVPKDDFFWLRWSYATRQKTLMGAYKSRSWGVGANPVFLNTEELATLWHFPTINMKAPLVKKQESKRAEPPVGLPITTLEDTLPGVEQSGALEQQQSQRTGRDEPAKTAQPPLTLPTIEDADALPDVLPHPTSPSQPKQPSQEPEPDKTQEAQQEEPKESAEEPREPEHDPMEHLLQPRIPGGQKFSSPDDNQETSTALPNQQNNQEDKDNDESVPPNLPI